jgi:hypothetical protein
VSWLLKYLTKKGREFKRQIIALTKVKKIFGKCFAAAVVQTVDVVPRHSA